jgi:cell division protein FtsW (lipid II flippase)
MPWLRVTWVLLWLYTLITVLVLFFRPDFINLTVCVIALFMMFNTDRITRFRFRLLVLGIFITLLYDPFWFYMKFKSYSEDNPKDSRSNEINIRRFSLLMSIASYILRVNY